MVHQQAPNAKLELGAQLYNQKYRSGQPNGHLATVQDQVADSDPLLAHRAKSVVVASRQTLCLLSGNGEDRRYDRNGRTAVIGEASARTTEAGRLLTMNVISSQERESAKGA